MCVLTVGLVLKASVVVLVASVFFDLVTLTILAVAALVRFQNAIRCSYEEESKIQYYSDTVNLLSYVLKNMMTKRKIITWTVNQSVNSYE